MSRLGIKPLLAALAIAVSAGIPAFAAPKVAMITSESGLGDKSFNDMMAQGMEKAKADFGADYVVIQPRAVSEFQSAIARAAAQGFDVIIGSSFDMIEPMKAVAKAFPDQKFGLVDVGPDPVAPNVASTVTKDWEGSFLVGYIAAKTTKTGTIGFVGGKDIPIIHRFFIGYYYGAKMANPDVKVLESYTGSFQDPAGGKEYTLALVNQGSDINFAVAGATSAGVIDAAKESKTFAIGVDSNQNYMAPGSVLTSMVKRVDTQAYDMIKAVNAGSFKGGEVKYYGLAEDGVAAAMDEYNKGLIADPVLAEVDGLKAKLLSGEIVVPNYFDLKPGQKEMGKPAMATPPSIADAK
ncbi:BMP family ABC transporter substrate-binding protein (plasmid) [Rhizobium leguminosarum]|nr:BMP family ABC transporter substrate-binding protein [Rhizobium leguminosarum]TBG93312.1 BMP family ABC transporter substrate-binding protein [Rhizobium leguminosarum]TBG98714.1 BMP family ABC transporter substrate-binding protein [Rhizobium leguminosarum]TBH29927.1 BMP family ABC transporter substrate-binding protein [Rhizobium leguminosarum]TBH50157.1 BMP family ABC transporter substrate-binding protein [Rhizobium leguminosarum]